MPRNSKVILACLLALFVAPAITHQVGALAPAARMRLEPAELVVDLNETFAVQVVIEGAADLGAFQFDLVYTPSIVQVQEVVVGEFLESTNQSVVPVGPDVNNAEGRTAFGAASFGDGPGPSGAGVLATVTCVAQGQGNTALKLQEVQVLDTKLGELPITVEEGRVVVTDAEGQLRASEQTASDTPTDSSGWVVPGLMLAALFAAILAIVIFKRRAND